MSNPINRSRALPFVSVIILNFNGKKYLKDCLSSVLGTDYQNFEVILVDNASTDGSLDLVEKLFGNDKRLKIIKNRLNLGFSGGNNEGFKHAMGDYIAFLNNDTIVDPHWLAHLVDTMQRDKTIGLAQSLLLEISGKEIQLAGWLFSDYLSFQHTILEGVASNTNFPLIFEVSFASGAAMIIRRDLVNEIGLFDPNIPFYYDDTLLSFKTWLAGKRVVAIPKSKVRHVWGGTMRGDTYVAAFHLLRAKLCLMFDVYFNFGDLLKAFFVLAFSLLRDWIYYILRKNLAVVSSHVKALWWVLRNFKHIWRNRLEHWSKAKISPEMLIAKFIRIKIPMSICLLPYTMYRNYCLREAKKCENMLMRYS